MRTPTLRRRSSATRDATPRRPALGGALDTRPDTDAPPSAEAPAVLARLRRPVVWVVAGGAIVVAALVWLGQILVAAAAVVLTVAAAVWVFRRSRVQDEPEAPSRDAQEWTQGASLATKATTALLAAALLTGPAAAAWLLLGAGSRATQQLPAAVTDQADRSARRGAAQDLAGAWVRAWLTTPADQAQRLTRFWSDEIELPPRAIRIRAVSIVDAVASAPGVWSVTVAADPAAPGSPRRYFQVPVSVTGGEGTAGARVLALPSPIPGPGKAPDRVTTYQVQVARGTPLFQAVQAFVSALAAGQGDITRYLSPGTRIRAISPSPYRSAAVTELSALRDVPGATAGSGTPSNGSVVKVRASVQLRPAAQPASSPGLAGQYALTLTARAGRWEVTAIDTTPQTDQDPATDPAQP